MYRIQGADQKEYGPITAEQVRQWIGENRLNRFTLCAGTDGIWKPLGQFLEFADVLAQTPGPVAAGGSMAPAAAGSPGLGGGPAGDGREQALARVKVPAICMMVMAGLSTLYAFALPFQMKQQLAMMANQPGMDANARAMIQNWAAAPMWLWFALVLVSVLINGVILLGSLRMLKLRSYGLSMAAAIVSILPCGSVCCCLGIAFGVWAAITLNRPDVKSHFQP